MSGEPVKRALAVLTHPTLSLRENTRASVTRLEWCVPCGCAFYAMPRPRVMVCDAHRYEDKGVTRLRATGGPIDMPDIDMRVISDKVVDDVMARGRVRGSLCDAPVGGVHVVLDHDDAIARVIDEMEATPPAQSLSELGTPTSLQKLLDDDDDDGKTIADCAVKFGAFVDRFDGEPNLPIRYPKPEGIQHDGECPWEKGTFSDE